MSFFAHVVPRCLSGESPPGPDVKLAVVTASQRSGGGGAPGRLRVVTGSALNEWLLTEGVVLEDRCIFTWEMHSFLLAHTPPSLSPVVFGGVVGP